MSDFQHAQFHVGVRVGDIDAAMADLGSALGLTWAPLVEREQRYWTPEDGAATTPLRFTYSREGPQHVELLQGGPGSIWSGDDAPGFHHIGFWADDVALETERLLRAGWRLEACDIAPEDGYGGITYVRSPDGLLVEPVSSAFRPKFESWWAGEPLY